MSNQNFDAGTDGNCGTPRICTLYVHVYGCLSHEIHVYTDMHRADADRHDNSYIYVNVAVHSVQYACTRYIRTHIRMYTVRTVKLHWLY